MLLSGNTVVNDPIVRQRIQFIDLEIHRWQITIAFWIVENRKIYGVIIVGLIPAHEHV